MIEYMNTDDRRMIKRRIKYLRTKLEGKDFKSNPTEYIELLAIKKLVRIADHNGQWADDAVSDLVSTDHADSMDVTNPPISPPNTKLKKD